MQSRYPENWIEISEKARQKASWQCEKCGVKHEDTAGKRIQVHHLDYDPANSNPDNLIALCPPCHLDRHKRKKGSVSPGQITLIQLLGIPHNSPAKPEKTSLTPVTSASSTDRDIQKQDLISPCQLTIYQLLLIENEEV